MVQIEMGMPLKGIVEITTVASSLQAMAKHLYIRNNVEVLAVNPGAVTVAGNLSNTRNIYSIGKYQSIFMEVLSSIMDKTDWRLVETDYFENNSEGWNVYQSSLLPN